MMEVMQTFSTRLERFEHLLVVEVSRSPNMNGFIRSIKHRIPENPHEMRHACYESANITEEERDLVMDTAAQLWDEYWNTRTMEGQTIARGWREWSKKRS